jgi:alcohol dehydrogenase
MLATNVRPGRTSALSFEGLNTFQWPGLPLLAVPTTCGTGSEVTWVSVLTDTEDRRKLSIKGKHMFPAAAIVDSHVLRSLPAKLVSYTGLDALTHALEATLCRPGVSHAVSDVLAEEATTLLLSNLRAAAAGGDDSALEAVARGSTMAGLAFGNADVGAVHCLSETIGGLYGVPHGLGNAIFLHAALRFHLRREDGATRGTGAVRARLERLAQRAQLDAQCAFRGIRDGGERSEGAELLLGAVEALVRDLRIPPLSSLSLPAADWEKIAALSVSNCSNVSNPGGELTKSDYLSIMHAAG